MNDRPDRPDRRVSRTHRLLREALLALVTERGWEAVTVRDVCARADVGRSTFYAHFPDTDALLLSGLEPLMDALRAAPAAPGVVLPFMAPLLEHTQSHRPLFVALLGTASGRAVQRRFRALVLTLVGEQLPLANGVDQTTAVRFVAGGCHELLAAALEGPPRPIAALDAEAQALALRVLG